MYGCVYGMIRLRKLPHNCQVMKENLIFFHTNNIDHTPATASDFMWSNFIYTANSAHASNQHHCLLLLFPSFFFPIHFRIVVLAAKWNWNCRSLRLVRQGTEKKNVYWLLRFVELKLWHVHRSFRIYIFVRLIGSSSFFLVRIKFIFQTLLYWLRWIFAKLFVSRVDDECFFSGADA